MLGADSANQYAPQYVSMLMQQIPATYNAQLALLTPAIQAKVRELLNNVFYGYSGNATLRDMALMSTADQLITIVGKDFINALLHTQMASSVLIFPGDPDANNGDWYDFVQILTDRLKAFIPISIEAPPVPVTPVLTRDYVNPMVENITPASSTSQQLVQPFICTQDVMLCPDGSFVARTDPGCRFPSCPSIQSLPTQGDQILIPIPSGGGLTQTQLPGTLLQTQTPKVIMTPVSNQTPVTSTDSSTMTLILIALAGLVLMTRN